MQSILARGGLIVAVTFLACGCTTAPSAQQATANQDVGTQRDKEQAVAAVKVATEAVELLRHRIEEDDLGAAAKDHLQRAQGELHQARVALAAGHFAAAQQTARHCYNGLVFSSGIGKNSPSRLNLYYRLPAGPLI